ncbi:MAG: glycosyltransferase [Rhodospirillales bacterium]|nr:glycosyltransferase [Rhodospirillales bacterium]
MSKGAIVASASMCLLSQSAPRISTVDILGVKVSAINLGKCLTAIDAWIDARQQSYVCVADAHAIMESHWDDQFRQIHNAAALVTPDGMPLVWLCRLAGYRDSDRVYGPDLLLALCEHSVSRGYRHFFYGGGPGVAQELALRLSERFPALVIAGTASPPFRVLSDGEMLDAAREINSTRPDIVWVGLSTPKQERWMQRQLGHVEAPILIGIGAAFDFHSGRKPQAPRWMQRGGLEWLFRLGTEPRRLWRRYLTSLPMFAILALQQLAGLGTAPPSR